jgi:hypothetical protein
VQDAENGCGFDFLGRYHKDGDEFLNHIVLGTGDETWVSFVKVETKEQSKEWMHTYSPEKSKKFKQMLSTRKVMATVFLGRKGVYCETLKKPHRTGHSEQKGGILTFGVVLPHDNVRPHTASRTPALQEYFNWELFDHPPDSSERLPPVYLPEEMVAITALQQ